jgi:protein-tyrosine-phosphatase
MAEGLFRKAAEKQDYAVSSAGVSAGRGGPASPETVMILREKGIELGNFASRPVDEEILDEATHVFCLTGEHLRRLQGAFPEHEDKYFLATEFVEIDGEVGRDISDPIGCGREAYEEVCRELEGSIEGILGFLAVKAGG